MIERQPACASRAKATTGVLRQFAALWLLLFAGLGGWQAYHRGCDRTSLALLALAAVGLAGLIRPRTIRPLFVLLTTASLPVAWIVSHAVLAILFYLVFTPIGFGFRLLGRDALCRRRSPGQASYWVAKPQAADVRSYFRLS